MAVHHYKLDGLVQWTLKGILDGHHCVSVFETLQTGVIHLEYLLANLHSCASLCHTATRLGERLQCIYTLHVCKCVVSNYQCNAHNRLSKYRVIVQEKFKIKLCTVAE